MGGEDRARHDAAPEAGGDGDRAARALLDDARRCGAAALQAAQRGDVPGVRRWGGEARRLRAAAGHPRGVATWLNPMVWSAAAARHGEAPGGAGPAAIDGPATLARAQAAVRVGDLDVARRLAGPAACVAIQAGDADAAADAALTLAYAGDRSASRDALGDAERVARRVGDPAGLARVLALRARVEWAAGAVDAALGAAQEALAAARSAADPALAPQMQAGVAMLLAGRGELDEAASLAHELRACGQPFAAALSEVPLAVVAMESGDPARARDALEPLLPTVRALAVDNFTMQVLTVLARAEALDGRWRRCLIHCAEAQQTACSPHHEGRSDLWWAQGQALHALGDRSGLAGVAGEAAATADTEAGGEPTSAAAVADGLAGLLAAGEGCDDEALRRLAASASTWAALPRRAYAAEAWLSAAGAAQRAGRPDVARTARQAAADVAALAGAARLAARARAQLDATLVPVPDRPGTTEEPPAPATLVALTALTEREAEVVRLAATGRTNAEIGASLFLSPVTVRNYLSAAFAKLGVRRRSELAALLAGAPGLPTATRRPSAVGA
jgi:DNA-binding NarL/FixJ family response regulator